MLLRERWAPGFRVRCWLGCWLMALSAGAFAQGAKTAPDSPPPEFPAAQTAAPTEAISAREVAVFAALLQAPPPKGAPQFFDTLADSRILKGRSLAFGAPFGPDWPGRNFGAVDAGLLQDFRARNQKAWPIPERIRLPHLKVISPEEWDARLSDARRNPSARRLDGGWLALSRVGFSRDGTLALIGVELTDPGAMRARYVVLMQGKEGAWAIVKVSMETLIVQ